MIADNIKRIRDDIAETAINAGRDPSEITLVAVTKTRPVGEIEEAIEAGIVHLGENRVQEAGGKIPLVRGGVVWRLIGPLQSNKAKAAAGMFDWIDSVHSRKIAEALSSQADQLGKKLRVLVQVNISGEDAKSGVEPSEAEDLLRYVAVLPGLEARGIMTIGSFDAAPEKTLNEFRRMRLLFEKLRESMRKEVNVDVLSMGMSGDYRAAIREGSTMVRIGAAIFGERK
ncbi:MAG: YggS family pyridoxal phosphate-dependent enzyme [Candidatus Latescibacterota bacterium]